MAELKYYEIFVTGELEVDKDNNPIKNEDGSFKVKYTRKSAPSAELLAEGLTANKFFQCEAVEVNVDKDSIKSASGKSWDIGPMVSKGYAINIFERQQKKVYEAIVERYIGKKYTQVVAPSADDKPVIHLSNWALPGCVIEFATGFPYYPHTRNKKTHVMEPLLQTKYGSDGKILPKTDPRCKTILTTGKLFLFANELDNAEAHIKDAISALAEYKVPEIAGGERKEEVATANADVKSPSTTPETPASVKPAEKDI
jgi:hypothetical protein